MSILLSSVLVVISDMAYSRAIAELFQEMIRNEVTRTRTLRRYGVTWPSNRSKHMCLLAAKLALSPSTYPTFFWTLFFLFTMFWIIFVKSYSLFYSSFDHNHATYQLTRRQLYSGSGHELLCVEMKAKARFENFLIRLFYGPQQRYQHLAGNEVKSDLQRIVPFQKLALVTLALPLGGFAFCVLWSMLYNFDDSTSTHCNVPNYLPSVSASIGAYSPQKYIWRLTIALHSAPRYLVSMTYYKLFHSSTCLLTLNCVEVSSLLGLSIISSTENFGK